MARIQLSFAKIESVTENKIFLYSFILVVKLINRNGLFVYLLLKSLEHERTVVLLWVIVENDHPIFLVNGGEDFTVFNLKCES